MKKILFVLLLPLLVACDKPEEEQLVGCHSTTSFFQYFITSYSVGEKFGISSYGDRAIYITLKGKIDIFRYPDYYSSVKGQEEHAASTAEFLRLSEQNGDTSYNRELTYLVRPSRGVYAETFAAIDVVCTNRDIDAKHPAGTSLGDIMTVSFLTCAPYIRNHYTGDEWTHLSRRLCDLKPDEMTMTRNFWFGFTKDLERYKPHELVITITNSEGKVYTVNAEFYYVPEGAESQDEPEGAE